MCGIAGLWQFGGGAGEELRARAAGMADALQHRGPDDDGVWVDAAAGIALGFRRLSIIDLSQAGAQPMVSASGRYVIVFNGEIYNFQRLRDELGIRELRGHSDTEVLLACIEAWGIEGAVQRFIGMFAFALWDRGRRTLTLVRDRLGIKPLYYALTPRGVAFASELKALGRGEIDRGALALYMRYGYVPAPHAIFRGVAKLLPGTMLTIDANGESELHAYWDSARVAERAAANRFRGSETEAIDALETLLADAVRLRLIADVPLGVFLSGGIDSPLVTALMTRETGTVATFTIGFEGLSDEVPQARAIARHLGTRHTEAIISGADVLDAIPLMGSIYDEPFGDSSAIPTFLVSRLARQHVTVALSGDGGDELFGGYHRYFLGQRLDARVAQVPRRLRRPAGRAAQALSRIASTANLRDRLRGLGEALVLDDPIARFTREIARDLVDVLDAQPRGVPVTELRPQVGSATELMMYLDTISFLPDDILAKVDRASMAVSLEAREPLLDHRVVEFAWSLPLSMKMRDAGGKWILRKLLAKYLPPSLIDSGKRGFGLPLRGWLNGPLRDWAESLVDERRIAREGWFDVASVRRVWDRGPVYDVEQVLWRLLMFQQWLDEAPPLQSAAP
ncbi:MAG TPA: asparagine synthase (glutamine-hydrolyzing) [Thermoanaerobaculia bacterium]|nr:asparagine synthase (glutamine-hydrolyzing) [Thermoanaerobaculia bacterium]